MIGTIIKQISDAYTVFSNNESYECKARGKFRNLNISPLVGDNVDFDEKKKVIEKIHKRKNVLERPSISNVDQALIVISVKEPDFSTNLLDKLLVIIEFNNINPVICFSKMDLLVNDDSSEIAKYKEYYEKIGYKVLYSHEINEINETLKNKITVLTGQSGAGKSTLLNVLNTSLHLKTGEISQALGRGRHTTRHTELINYAGGWVADTPGFSAISFTDMTKADIRDNFIEFNSYRDKCAYRDCMHTREDKCGIKEALRNGNILESRYNNYLNFINEE